MIMKNIKLKATIEIILVFIAFSVIFRWLAFYTRDLGWNGYIRNLIYVLWGTGIPLLRVWVTKTNVGFNKWRIGLYGGFLVFWFGFVQSFGFGAVDMLGFKFSSLPAMLVMISFVTIMIFGAYFSLRNS